MDEDTKARLAEVVFNLQRRLVKTAHKPGSLRDGQAYACGETITDINIAFGTKYVSYYGGRLKEHFRNKPCEHERKR